MILLLAALAHAVDHHVLRFGETVASVAWKEEVDERALRALNGLPAQGDVPIGTVLLLPGPEIGAPAAVVLAVSGTANATLPGAAPTPLVVTGTLPAGTLVCTEAGSFATLRLATEVETLAHDEITLLGRTCLTLDAAWSERRDHASLVSVREGSVDVRATDASPGSVTVRTEAGVTTSDSGGFRVTVEKGAARTEALQGLVAVLGSGKEVELTKGFGSRVRKGEAPSEAVPLLAAGVPERPGDGEALRRPDFTWSQVERALGYRIEIASTPDFTSIVHAEDVGLPPWRPDTLFLPFRGSGLWWRVSSFDRTGFLGPPSPARRIGLPPGVGP